MFQIGNFLIIVGAVLAAILVATQLYREIVVADDWRWDDLLTILQYVLVLLVASIPVAMPAVFSITMALGALTLSKQKAIVSRLAAIEEMAGVDILCTDKTGTLTKNELKLGDPILVAATDPEAGARRRAGVALRGSPARSTPASSRAWDPNATKATPRSLHPLRPRHQANRSQGQGCPGHEITVAKGAPRRSSTSQARRRRRRQGQGDRRRPRREGQPRRSPSPAPRTAARREALLGILPMFDPPAMTSKATIDAVKAKGIAVKMITGDDTAIAIEVARELGMGTNIVAAADAFPKDMSPDHVPGPYRRRHREGRRLRPRLPRAQVRHRQGAAIARPPRRHDRRRRRTTRRR